MKSVRFYTLGCKVNQYETAVMSELFSDKGYEVTNDYRDERASGATPDVVVINTCAVTAESVRKSGQLIRRIRRANPEAILAVVGCFSQIMPEDVENIEGIDIIMGVTNRGDIVNAVENVARDVAASAASDTPGTADTVATYDTGDIAAYTAGAANVQDAVAHIDAVHGSGAAVQATSTQSNKRRRRVYEELNAIPLTNRTRAYVKIQDGCSQFCSYCIVPYIRGPMKSRKPDKTIHEAEALIKKGYHEIVLTGIHISSFGNDSDDGTKLDDLILKISKIDGLERLRLGSLEPTIITRRFMENMKKCENVFCPHFHLSLQCGSNSVLKRMNRKYTTDEYINSVNMIREFFPDAAMTTDIIVGFPGESEEEFSESFGFCKEVGFSKIHVFKYSPRKGTPAATFDKQISSEIKTRRSESMVELSKQMAYDFVKKYIGRNVSIIVEKAYFSDIKCGIGAKFIICEGLTPNYIHVRARLSPSEVIQNDKDFIDPSEGTRNDKDRLTMSEGTRNDKDYLTMSEGTQNDKDRPIHTGGATVAGTGGADSLIGATVAVIVDGCVADTLVGVCRINEPFLDRY